MFGGSLVRRLLLLPSLLPLLPDLHALVLPHFLTKYSRPKCPFSKATRLAVADIATSRGNGSEATASETDQPSV